QSPKNAPILIHGIAEVLHQPEFSQLEKVQMLLHFLEKDQDLLYSAIFQTVDINLIPQVRVKIGSENDLAPMQSCTLISANYYQENTPVGSVGIIGPTRMLYQNTIPLVETTASYLSQILS
ncbi:MAG: heat-inducible transcriptional repressor HrcA, partial [Cyanobacteria bacterium J149]